MISIHRLHLGQVSLPSWHPRQADWTSDIHNYVIVHPDGLIVVDTGPRSGHPVIDERYSPDVTSIVEARNGSGFDERAVAALVNTHLHFDHCGQNHRFDKPATPAPSIGPAREAVPPANATQISFVSERWRKPWPRSARSAHWKTP